MTFRALLYAYVLGGLTFLPLLLVAVVGLGWSLLPIADEAAEGNKKDGATEKASRSEDDQKAIDALLAKKHEEISEGGASGTFAVLRKYDFQAANAALVARHNVSANAVSTGAGGDGGVEAAKESESVYQSMYRSVFDRGKAGSQTSVLANEEEAAAAALATAKTRRNVTPANVFYIVLRHGHLMLYDSSSQMEVRHVVSLAHHSLSLSEGGHLPGTDEQHGTEREIMRDGDLFIKRTAIVLTPVDIPNGHMQSRNSPAKPFYLFSASCSEKEDFYHSLLYTRSRPPIPEPLDPNDTIKLQSTLHSTSLTPETRAINALVGRIFLGLYHTDRAKQFVQSKVEKKISRVQKPAFIASLAVKAIDLGDSAPVLSNPRLKDLHISGDMTIACDVKYTGAIKLTIAAVAKIDLGTRFKTRFIDLVLAVSLQRLAGHLLVRIKPPPSNRLWFCFESPPEMDIKVEPVVSQRQITYTWILRQIEDRIRAVFSETLVKPNWDDVPWFDTRGQNVRGGIWRDEGSESADQSAEKPTGADSLKERNSKTKSMPVLPGMSGETDSSAASSGSETASRLAASHSANASDAETILKRRSVASLPAQSATPPPNISSERSANIQPPLPMRSPSYSSSTPSIALDESSASIDPARRAETAPQGQTKWRLRAAAQQLPTRKDAVEAMREMRDKATALRETGVEAAATSKDGHAVDDSSQPTEGDPANVSGRQSTDTEAPDIPDSPNSTQTSFAARSLKSTKRTDTDLSSTSKSSKNTQGQQRKQNILAATAAATNAARNWSWNAYQSAKKNSPARAGSGATQPQSDAPMGRGQPLPPPGQPLPGPNKGLFGSFGGSVKRKPVLPPRKPTVDEGGTSTTAPQETRQNEAADSSHVDSGAWDDSGIVETPVSDEFGPWSENSGVGIDALSQNSNMRDPQSDLLTGTDGIRVAGSDHSNEIDDGIRVAGIDDSVEDDDTTTRIPVQKKTAPPLPPRRPDPKKTSLSHEAFGGNEQTSIHVSAVPPAQSAEEAEAKFALGADVGEEDFKDAPKDDDMDEAGTSAAEYDVSRSADNCDTSGKADSVNSNVDEQDKVVAVPAPIEDADVNGHKDLLESSDDDEKLVGSATSDTKI